MVVLSRSSTSWQHLFVGVLLILTAAMAICVGFHVPTSMAVGSPKAVGSLTPYAKPGVVCTLPHRRPPLQIFPPAWILAPPTLPPNHCPFSRMGFSVSGNVVL